MRGARFIKSATQWSQYPTLRLPHIAFAGRSNVGKSSLINCLVGQKALARTSSTPGRTQVINFFDVSERLVLVDLPGYGYAKVPVQVREQWAGMIEEFLHRAELLRLVVVIVDGRHDPTELDRQMVEWLRFGGLPFEVVATKCDKLGTAQRRRSIERAVQELSVDRVLPFSALSGLGRKELWRVIESSAQA